MKDYILKNGKVYNSQSRCFEEKNIVVSEDYCNGGRD